MDFHGKVAFVTGASRGIGKSIATLFAQHGAHVVIHYYKSEKEALHLKEQLEEAYSISCMVVKADVRNEEDVNNMIQTIVATFKTIDILVNNAGIAHDNLMFDKSKEEFMEVIETNLLGPFLVSKYVGPIMLEKESGVIVNIASNNGLDCNYKESMDYDASKAGLISLTHNLALMFAPYVRVNAVAPGWVETDMNQDLDATFRKQECDKILLHRFGNVDEIAKVVCFLSSNDASYINNTVIRVDGGISLWI